MADVSPDFYSILKRNLGGRLRAIAVEASGAALHAERAAIARHILEDWDGAVRQILSVYISNFAGGAEDDATVTANLDLVLDTMAKVGVWGPLA